MIDPGLEGRVALVTGGNNPHGIGAAVAQALTEQGVAVFVHYFSQHLKPPAAVDTDKGEPHAPGLDFHYAMQAESAHEVVRAIRGRGGLAECWEADFNDAATIPQLFDRAEDAFGFIDILVNNAADYAADTFVPEASLERGGGNCGTPVPRHGPSLLRVTTGIST